VHRAAQANGGHSQPRPARRGRGHLPAAFVVALLLALGAVGLFAAWTGYQMVLGPYQTRIYPNVYVLGVDLSGLTPAEATEHLAQALSHYDAGLLTLSDGERTWVVPWSEAGLRLDVDATAQVAFTVGRADRGLQNLLSILNMWEGHTAVAPVFIIDPGVARGVLERLAPEVAVPPTDATLRLEEDQLVAVPGQPGRALDVDATLDNIVATVAHLGPDNQFALSLQIVPPRLADTEAAQVQAEEMLDRQVQISTYDWLTDENFAWTLEREAVVTWLRVEQAEDGSGPTIRVAPEAVQATLESLAAEMGEGRGFRLQEATEQVLNLFEAGGGAVELRLTHPPRMYIVQPGDDLTTIAARFGMPPGLIAEANPDVDLNWLQVGQELTIPSEDVLRPYPPVPGKRIVINTSDQRMRVYENGALLYDWPVSTGIASSPTYSGEFQVLDKNEKAYASQWDLWMPHFIAVYRAGGDTYNGIHALPILSDGRRLWEGALGSPASYGCIILGIQEAETLYNWAEIGVPVTIE
jgi:lipoprotein-anchoring transpeptidase ErfK/SrfK